MFFLAGRATPVCYSLRYTSPENGGYRDTLVKTRCARVKSENRLRLSENPRRGAG